MSINKQTSAFGLALLASSCAGAPPSSLVDARAAYRNASQGPAEQVAPAQLHVAETSLKLAEQTYADEGDSPNARDRGYIAMRKAELADVQARTAQDQAKLREVHSRSALAEQKEHAATTEELSKTREQLARERATVQNQNGELQAETERRKQAEAAQADALAALGRVENVKKEARGTVITLSGSVIFASGGSELLPAARNKLSEVATALDQGETSKISVEGHTDSVGSDPMNQQLSMRRASAVRDSLVAGGVAAERISVVGYGSTRPVADNTSEAGRANNRRVEIVVQPSTTAQQQTGNDAASASLTSRDRRHREPAPAANAQQ
jgi:outer membrane protein OmpA-like peptidoglycan-associated protein